MWIYNSEAQVDGEAGDTMERHQHKNDICYKRNTYSPVLMFLPKESSQNYNSEFSLFSLLLFPMTEE
jgi:hypothetical protein